ncbi:MAG: hypothetical protein JSV35_03700 [Candidatus Bathyarchaeota archaeon]|nr:MAG: hypothetical protein JSV35_03700 [Candidatus Bathyarchaeota archaeon]
MRLKVLAFILAIAVVVSILSLLVFSFEGGFNGRGRGMASGVPESVWLVLFIAPLLMAISALGYSLVFPELSQERSRKPTSRLVEKESALSAVLRVLENDERKVIETLSAEGGIMLQKDIRWKTGFSRVKTHRILLRLTKRGIVSAEKHYNTNKITLADWLTNETEKS